MKEIKLWSLDKNENGDFEATSVETMANTETEGILEDLLVRSPELLLPHLKLIGRQTPTKGGPLDLLGLDEDGRLVVFELKRGMLTRDAVAQALDYASDLNQMDTESLCKHLANCSGKSGIDQIDDFRDWYDRNFPNAGDALKDKPRIALVGLGVDERALRMVNFLADSGVDIHILTFHAFHKEGKLFLAKHVESTIAKDMGSISQGVTKKTNQDILNANAEQLRVKDFLETVKSYFREQLTAYEWPGRTSYSFSLFEKTESGNPTYRVYVSVYLDFSNPGFLIVILQKNAVEAAPHELEKLPEILPNIAMYNSKYQQIEISVNDSNWENVLEQLDLVMPSVIRGWKSKQHEGEISTDKTQGESS